MKAFDPKWLRYITDMYHLCMLIPVYGIILLNYNLSVVKDMNRRTPDPMWRDPRFQSQAKPSKAEQGGKGGYI